MSSGGMGGSGGVFRNGDLGLGWKGFRSRCIGFSRFGDTGGGVELLFVSSRSRREKFMAGESMVMGFRRMIRLKALGCWATSFIFSVLRRCGFRWWRGGGLKRGGVSGRRFSSKFGWFRRMGFVMRSRLKGLLSFRKFMSGDWVTVSGSSGGGMVSRGVSELLVGSGFR